MSFPYFIARRYFQPHAKKNLVQRISLISFFSIATSTTALLLVLSVFNGLEAFIHSKGWTVPDFYAVMKKSEEMSEGFGAASMIGQIMLQTFNYEIFFIMLKEAAAAKREEERGSGSPHK